MAYGNFFICRKFDMQCHGICHGICSITRADIGWVKMMCILTTDVFYKWASVFCWMVSTNIAFNDKMCRVEKKDSKYCMIVSANRISEIVDHRRWFYPHMPCILIYVDQLTIIMCYGRIILRHNIISY